MSPRPVFVWALAINGASMLHDDPNSDGVECLIRPSSIDMLTYDRDYDLVTITLRNRTTIECHGHRREVYTELAAALDTSICKGG